MLARAQQKIQSKELSMVPLGGPKPPPSRKDKRTHLSHDPVIILKVYTKDLKPKH